MCSISRRISRAADPGSKNKITEDVLSDFETKELSQRRNESVDASFNVFLNIYQEILESSGLISDELMAIKTRRRCVKSSLGEIEKENNDSIDGKSGKSSCSYPRSVVSICDVLIKRLFCLF